MPPADSASTFRRMIAEGRRGDAADYFMTDIVGLPQEMVEQARTAPWRAWQEGLAHTLAYDAEIMGDYRMRLDLAARVDVPTVVLRGGASWEWLQQGNAMLAEAIPGARLVTLPDQWHDVDAAVLAPALKEFFG
jgi:pimeloyl-ACP methyl ester carboxylesterase